MENKNKKILLLSILSTLAAVFLHSYLTSKFYALSYGQATGLSACNINSVFNCDATSASPYAQWFGVPVALLGASMNCIILLLSLISYFQFSERPDRAHRAALLLSFISVLTSLAMGAISTSLIGAVCLFCVGTYLLSFVTFFCIYKSSEKTTSWIVELKDYMMEEKWILVLFILVPAGAFFMHKSIQGNYGGDRLKFFVQEKIQAWQADANVQSFTEDSGLVLSGQKEPVMTIVEFADYLCPHCKHAYPTLHAFSQSRSDVKLIFKSFPLDGSCNPDPQMGKGDGLRCQLSLAVICSEKLAKQGWSAHHFIFDNQEEFYQTPWAQIEAKLIAEVKGLDQAQLKSCMQSNETMIELKKQAQEGIQSKITGTPAIFVNGKLLNGGQSLPMLEEAYKTLRK